MAEHQLAKPLTQNQIEAAARFWKDGHWESKEFGLLRTAFPNPLEAISIKAIAVNILYGTNIFAILKVAECVERVLTRTHSTGSDLVEELVSEIVTVTKQRNYSFASKYGYFFIDPKLPILDGFAEWMVQRHIGNQLGSHDVRRYHKFCEDLETLKDIAGLSCSCADLDPYLWVAGEYWYWLEHPKYKINGDLKTQFENLKREPQSEPLLAALLGVESKGSELM